MAADPAALGADILVGSHSHTLLYGSAAPGGPQVPSPIPPILASPPANESYAVIGPYPTWVERSGAAPLPIVQAAWASRCVGVGQPLPHAHHPNRIARPPHPHRHTHTHLRYLGVLNTTFDAADGGLLAASGAPLLLGGKNSTNYVAEDPIVAAQIANLTLGVDAFSKQARLPAPA